MLMNPFREFLSQPCRWGTFVALHPLPVMTVALIVSLSLACGLSCWKVTTDPVDLWVASGSQARQDMQYFNEHFWKFYRIEQVILVPKQQQEFIGQYTDDQGAQVQHPFGAVFTRQLLLEALDLQLRIERLQARDPRSDRRIGLSDICFKPLPGRCATQSVFTYFANDPEQIRSENYLQRIDVCTG